VLPGTFTVSISAVRYVTTTQSATLAADSRLDVVLQRNDTFPADGTYSYTLVVRSPAWCLTHAYATRSGICARPPGSWVNSNFSWDGQLVVDVDGASLRFVLPSDAYGAWGDRIYSTFVFQRTGTQLKGTIVASAPILMSTVSGMPITSAFMQTDVFSGETDNGGRFWGAFDGLMRIGNFYNVCDTAFDCPTSGFTWTLTPR